MSAASAEIMAVGSQMHKDLQELFQKLHGPDSILFNPFVKGLTDFKHPVKRFQLDFAANMAICYVFDKLTLEIDVPRYEGASSDEFNRTKVTEVHNAWVASRDTKYSAYARELVKAGVGNVYTFLPKEKESTDIKFVYLGKNGQVHEETFQFTA